MAFDPRQIITDSIIARMESGDTLAYHKPWVNGLNKNPATGSTYGALNQMLLKAAGFADPRWYSPKYCMDHKLDFKGSKTTQIVTYFDGNKDKGKEGAAEREAESIVIAEGVVDGKQAQLRMWLTGLINAEQIKGLPPLSEYLGVMPFSPIEVIEAMAATMMKETGLKIIHGGNMACYIPRTHTIKMPMKEFFKSPLDYYATLLHEMGHATSHHSTPLTARKLDTNFGSPAYAAEEGAVDLASGQTLGLVRAAPSPTSIEQHAAYIKSWLSVLKGDKNAIFVAARDAKRISDQLCRFVPQAMMEKILGKDAEIVTESGIILPARAVTIPQPAPVEASPPVAALAPPTAPRKPRPVLNPQPRPRARLAR